MVEVIQCQERRVKMAGIIVEDVSFPSEGYRLKGRTYRPTTEGRHPAVLICHGYPGDNKNMDLAEEMALRGYAALVFYYRGAWGSEGMYGFEALAPSARDALKYLRGQPWVDVSRVAMVSHSMGAIPLTKIMSEDRGVKAGVLMSPLADMSPWRSKEVLDHLAPVFLKMAEGKLSGWTDARLRESVAGVKSVNPIENVGKVKAPLLFVVGSADTVTVPESCRMLYEAARQPKSWAEISGADHGYSEHRWPLFDAVLGWLKENL
jgi:dienelactone hydrolase